MTYQVRPVEAGTPPGGLAMAMAQIGAVAVVDPAQAQVRERILAFAATHPDCLHRSCLDGHLTGSALLVDPPAERTLLIHHAKLDRWLQPGGHADGDGDLGRVALREAGEETGLDDLILLEPAVDLDIHEIPARGAEPAHLHLDVRFVVIAAGGLIPRHNHEALAARWMQPEDPEVSTSAELSRAVSAALLAARTLGWSVGGRR